MDFDIDYEVFDIISSINGNGKFYLFANRYRKLKGLFLMEVDENDPCNKLGGNKIKFIMIRNF